MSRLPSPFGPAAAIAFLAGVTLVQAMPALPARSTGALALLVAVVFLAAPTRVRPAAMLLAGFAWACVRGDVALSARLAPALEGTPLRLVVEVVDLPVAAPTHVRFDALVRAAWRDGMPIGLTASAAGRTSASRIRLSWYDEARALPQPGERLTVEVKLKRPRGTVNRGGFDFERFALERQVIAVGSVRAVLARDPPAHRAAIDRRRLAFSQNVVARFGDSTASGLLRALAVGDTSGIAASDWSMLRATGTTHLVAISGLHVGLVASLGALLARGLHGLWPPLGLRMPRPRSEALLALIAAAAYAELAGSSLPVFRTLLMIAVVLAARWLARPQSPVQALALASTTLLIADPLAVLAPGFWLSFAGVAWLLFCLGGRGWPLQMQSVARTGRLLSAFGRAQLAAAIGLLPLTVYFFQQSALIGPLANLFAVPWISFVSVPLGLLALAAFLLWPFFAELPLVLAELSLRLAAWALRALADLPLAEIAVAGPGIGVLALALAGCAMLLAPRALPGRGLGALLLLPLLWPVADTPARGQLEIEVLDVGQGLAVLVRTSSHTLLYDAGIAVQGGYDSGERIVAPALHARSIRRLDALVVSHRDRDHAGGAPAVIAEFRPRRVFRGGGDPADLPCVAGEGWHWDGVEFKWLHPPPHFPPLGNDSSCVLQITAGASSALLPGDVSETIESRLIASANLRADLLVAAHHGSRSASSDAFVAAVRPTVVVFSRGYRHHYGHPHTSVVQRFSRAGAERFDTAVHGAVRFRLDPRDGITLRQRERLQRPRYWHEPALVE